MQSKNPIFIMGHPRSGTTITAWLLGHHPQISYIEAETNIFNLEVEKLIKSPFRALAVDVYRAYLSQVLKSDVWKKSFEVLEDDLLTDPNPYPSLRRFFDSLLKDPSKDSFVEKTPLHLFYADTIRKVYPDAIFLIPIRDEQEIIRSMAKKEWCPLTESGKQMFFDIIQWEIHRVQEKTSSLSRVYTFKLDEMTQCPEVLISLVHPYFEDTWDSLREAHKKRVERGIPKGDSKTWKRMA